jgi:hypothetical protein
MSKVKVTYYEPSNGHVQVLIVEFMTWTELMGVLFEKEIQPQRVVNIESILFTHLKEYK